MRTNQTNYATIADTKEFEQSDLTLDARLFCAGTIRAEDHHIAANFSEILDFLGVGRRPLPAPTAADSNCARRIERMARVVGASQCLELGSSSPGALRALQILKKTCVSDRRNFDARELADEHVEFFDMEPEEYFTRFAGDRRFDLIVIHGGEQPDEAFRWFCCSLRNAQSHAIWIVEVPEFISARPDERPPRSLGFLRLLHQFSGSFDLRTIPEAEKNTIVLWRDGRDQTSGEPTNEFQTSAPESALREDQLFRAGTEEEIIQQLKRRKLPLSR